MDECAPLIDGKLEHMKPDIEAIQEAAVESIKSLADEVEILKVQLEQALNSLGKRDASSMWQRARQKILQNSQQRSQNLSGVLLGAVLAQKAKVKADEYKAQRAAAAADNAAMKREAAKQRAEVTTAPYCSPRH